MDEGEVLNVKISNMTNSLIAGYLATKFEDAKNKLFSKKENEIWVTELIECSLKREWRKTLYFFESLSPPTIIGDFIHKGFLTWLKENGLYEIEVEFQKEYMNFVIKGRVDAINDSEVLEVKYMKTLKDRDPLEHHVDQVRLYLWLTDRPKGRIIYLTPDGCYEHDVTVPMSNFEINELLTAKQSPRYPEWECSYCVFKDFCSSAKLFHGETQKKVR